MLESYFYRNYNYLNKKSFPYTAEYLNSDNEITRNIIVNPFEKFERKRFIYYGKDLKNIGFSFYLWQKVDSDFIKKLKEKMLEDLGGAGDTSIF
ncbi:hypothetical protein VSU16_02585 [Cetobacterium somerae]|uniref:hypothetical protein n=1 Tax=Cetobacterium somerae TaxID=188913 RepID=UPI002E7B1439|nr:hypothetical protein [Cetobacterium somerae]WVJ01628.1 hypothetical protein VSU16_02585 [Cetobacterium somerae]